MAEYWFRKRRGLISKDLGWGWIPISKEGWIVTIIFAGSLLWLINKKGFNLLGFAGLLVLFAFVADKKTKDKVVFK